MSEFYNYYDLKKIYIFLKKKKKKRFILSIVIHHNLLCLCVLDYTFDILP